MEIFVFVFDFAYNKDSNSGSTYGYNIVKDILFSSK